jgi:single-strand DNA-binding protein
MINRVCIHGNLAQKPVVNGGCSRFEIATNERFVNKLGEHKSKTIWHPCTLFGKAAELFCEKAEIGSGVLIDGKLSNFDLISQTGTVREHRIVVEKFFFTERKEFENDEDEERFNK